LAIEQKRNEMQVLVVHLGGADATPNIAVIGETLDSAELAEHRVDRQRIRGGSAAKIGPQDGAQLSEENSRGICRKRRIRREIGGVAGELQNMLLKMEGNSKRVSGSK
jgi:hypothetical protein